MDLVYRNKLLHAEGKIRIHIIQGFGYQSTDRLLERVRVMNGNSILIRLNPYAYLIHQWILGYTWSIDASPVKHRYHL